MALFKQNKGHWGSRYIVGTHLALKGYYLHSRKLVFNREPKKNPHFWKSKSSEPSTSMTLGGSKPFIFPKSIKLHRNQELPSKRAGETSGRWFSLCDPTSEVIPKRVTNAELPGKGWSSSKISWCFPKNMFVLFSPPSFRMPQYFFPEKKTKKRRKIHLLEGWYCLTHQSWKLIQLH